MPFGTFTFENIPSPRDHENLNDAISDGHAIESEGIAKEKSGCQTKDTADHTVNQVGLSLVATEIGCP